MSRVERAGENLAIFSDDGVYRYGLLRRWGPGPLVGWVMLNPSTADAFQDDPTIRRCTSFSKRLGAGGLIVANLFAVRSPDPAVLRSTDDPVGPENVEQCRVMSEAVGSEVMVCAWGAHPMAAGGVARVREWRPDGPLYALGFTASGEPRHPLFVKADAPFQVIPEA